MPWKNLGARLGRLTWSWQGFSSELGLVTVAHWRGDNSLPLTWNHSAPHANDRAQSGEQILHNDLAQIREDLRPISVRTRAETMAPRVRSLLTCPVHASTRTRTKPCVPVLVHARPCAAPASIRTGKPQSYSLRASPDSPSPALSSGELYAARQAARALDHRGQTTPGHLHSILCLS
jgi:hypothetical protein